jgi:predicted RNase H-like HicB family nuclease
MGGLLMVRFLRRRTTMRTYTAVIERCPNTGFYVGYVPGFPGAHSQAESLDELNGNLREVVAMLLEDGDPPSRPVPLLLRQIAKDIGLTVE